MLDPLIGQTIDGRFEVRARLGQGGMGTVYRAWQRSVDREVAVKLMDPAFSRDPTAVRRFEREAQLASKLSQPNTVSVIDFGKHADGRLFIVMELIRGRTLHRIVSTEGKLALDRAARVTIQICDALDAAHRLGIIHRDLKLDNVMVLDDPPGRDLVKVLDFGLAKQVGELDPRATGSGIVVGTPRYIAPEVAVGGDMSPAADMYAVGVMLAELTIGKPLWRGDSLSDLLTQKLAPNDVVAGVPPPVHALVCELISSRPHERPSAAAVRERLSLLGSGAQPRLVVTPPVLAQTLPRRSEPTLAVRPRRTRRYGTVGLVLLGLVLAGLVVIGLVLPSSTPATPDAGVQSAISVPPPVIAIDAAAVDPWRSRIFPAIFDGGTAVEKPSEGGQVAIQLVADAGGVIHDPRTGTTESRITIHAARGSHVDVDGIWGGTVASASIYFDSDRSIVVHRPNGAAEHRITTLSGRTDTVLELGGDGAVASVKVPVSLQFSQSLEPFSLEATIAGVKTQLVVVPDRDRSIELHTPPKSGRAVKVCIMCPAPDQLGARHKFHVDATGVPVAMTIEGERLGWTPIDFELYESATPFSIIATIDGAAVAVKTTAETDRSFLFVSAERSRSGPSDDAPE